MTNRKARRKAKATGASEAPPDREPWNPECLPITPEQFFLANKVGDAAATGKMPRQSFASNFEEAKQSGKLEPGKYIVLGDRPINHAAMAMLDAFPPEAGHEEQFRRSLLWRVTFVAGDAYRDARAKAYVRKVGDDEYIGSPLVEAICTVPTKFGEATPLNAIFSMAEDLAKDWDPDADIDPE